MTSSSSKGPRLNVPPPPGSKAGNPYTRFIPREELQGFAAWAPESFTPGAGGPAEADASETPAANGPAAPADVDALLAAARQTGYQDGYRDGLAALDSFKQSVAAQATAQVGQLLQGIDEGFQALEQRIADTVAATAVELARQVLRSELAARPELVARVAAEAVGQVLASARQVVLHLHPLDLPLVAAAPVEAEALAARGTRLVPDDSIVRGGCRVESELGVIDACLDTRWAQAAAALGVDAPWPGGEDRT